MNEEEKEFVKKEAEMAEVKDFIREINNEEKIISCWIEGENEGKGTALVAASVVDLLFSSEIKAGVHHIDEILDLDDMMMYIDDEISLHIKN